MLKKILIAVGIVLVLGIAGFLIVGYFTMRGPDVSKYESLREPRIVQKADQKMLQVEAAGDPNTVAMKAFGLLFRTYYKNVKTHGMVAPLARWPKPLETPPAEWIGLYGLPVPASLEQLAETPSEPGYAVTLTTWQYGDVAEILHVGPYASEAPTVEKLKAFVAASGYAIAGPHEEEYLRGPGMFGKGDPNKYYTIIRYRVEKKPAEQPKAVKGAGK
ncbi:MAG TPA: GyrI-like domain-containing protein [Candidatus Edwardsbacteria bacterium]|nr:GyrI-like domain-containing protein [Candidatus Edwardsbacteria bacterium]